MADLITCSYCERSFIPDPDPNEGYSVHRDGFGVGPEVPLCPACGGSESPSLADIWEKIAQPAEGEFAYRSRMRSLLTGRRSTLTEPTPIWCLMPFVNNPDLTEVAVEDLLQQSVPTRILLIAQGASAATLDQLRVFAEKHHPRVLLWIYVPALHSLSGVWNRALEFAWELGADRALVVNNDVQLHHQTVEILGKVLDSTGALFVSAVGVREEQFNYLVEYDRTAGTAEGWLTLPSARGGPDYSCYLITKQGHRLYPFDERFIPAFCEDLDSHRRYMLGGDGARIFSVNLPYLHYASQTVKAYSPEERARFNKAYEGCLKYYQAKWGGRPNEETFVHPFDEGDPDLRLTIGLAQVTTPALQAWWREHPAGWAAKEDVDG